jgi:hypothetical protein
LISRSSRVQLAAHLHREATSAVHVRDIKFRQMHVGFRQLGANALDRRLGFGY